jgi:dTDP-4-dehydrorhamnose reductase
VRVVIVGAGGQLGGWLVDEFTRSDAEVIPLTRRDVDVTDPSLGPVIRHCRPTVLINATAWNDVDGAEDEPAAALSINHHAVRLLADAADAAGATLVHYSTDFVFDGCSGRPYVESDTPTPLNQYGVSKLAGEYAARSAGRHYILRLSSVFGGHVQPNGPAKGTIDRIIDALLHGESVAAFLDRTVSPSYAPDVARATKELIRRRSAHGVYHCVSSGFTTWYKLAVELRRQLGVAGEIREAHAADVAMRARRPRFCALSNAKLSATGISMREWREALRCHLRHRGLVWSPFDATPHHS